MTDAAAFQLEERTCETPGCEKRFRVMPSSSIRRCSQYCAGTKVGDNWRDQHAAAIKANRRRGGRPKGSKNRANP